MIAPANTGKDESKRMAVIKTVNTNKGIWFILIPKDRMLITVVIKLTAPRIEDTPARWREKIPRSTDAPAWAIAAARGG